MEILRQELEEAKANKSGYTALKNSFNEIEKRCVKHQKSEIEVKKQLTVHKEFVVSEKTKSLFLENYVFFLHIPIFRLIYNVKFKN